MAEVRPFTWDPPRERCEECGFEYESMSPADAAAALRSFGKRYRAPLTRFLAGEDGDALLEHHFRRARGFAFVHARGAAGQDGGTRAERRDPRRVRAEGPDFAVDA